MASLTNNIVQGIFSAMKCHYMMTFSDLVKALLPSLKRNAKTA